MELFHWPTLAELLQVWRNGLYDILSGESMWSPFIMWFVIILLVIAVAEWATRFGRDD